MMINWSRAVLFFIFMCSITDGKELTFHVRDSKNRPAAGVKVFLVDGHRIHRPGQFKIHIGKEFSGPLNVELPVFTDLLVTFDPDVHRMIEHSYRIQPSPIVIAKSCRVQAFGPFRGMVTCLRNPKARVQFQFVALGKVWETDDEGMVTLELNKAESSSYLVFHAPYQLSILPATFDAPVQKDINVALKYLQEPTYIAPNSLKKWIATSKR
jgi:hypothetical protein